MFFSIIIPVYNVEKYLRECIESILKQTFTDYEVILVDDGSTDKSGAICDEYAKKEKRIKVIHKANGGSADTRNIGAKEANGEYLLFIDSDDYIETDDFLNDIFQKAQTKPDIILYKFRKYFEESAQFQECLFRFPDLNDTLALSEKLNRIVSSDAFYCSAWSKAVRASIIKENNIVFEKGLIGEDQEWYYHVLLKAKSMQALDKSYIVYRQRKGSITKTWEMKNLTDCIYIIEKWSQEISKADIDDRMKNALLGSISKLYCNLLIGYAGYHNKEKKEQYQRIKALVWLLQYRQNPRVQKISIFQSVFGLRLTIKMLEWIRKIK